MKKYFKPLIRKGLYGLDTSKFDATLILMDYDGFGTPDFKFKGSSEDVPLGQLSATSNANHSDLWKRMFGNNDTPDFNYDYYKDLDKRWKTSLENSLKSGQVTNNYYNDAMTKVYKGNNSVVWSNPDDDEAFTLTTGFDYSTPQSTMTSLPELPTSVPLFRNFGDAFKYYRGLGAKTFEYNGKSYTTLLREESPKNRVETSTSSEVTPVHVPSKLQPTPNSFFILPLEVSEGAKALNAMENFFTSLLRSDRYTKGPDGEWYSMGANGSIWKRPKNGAREIRVR